MPNRTAKRGRAPEAAWGGPQRQAGFTVFEVIIASGIGVMVLGAAAAIAQIMVQAHEGAASSSACRQEVTAIAQVVTKDLRESSAARVVVDDLSDGNSMVTLQVKTAANSWGAYDERVGDWVKTSDVMDNAEAVCQATLAPEADDGSLEMPETGDPLKDWSVRYLPVVHTIDGRPRCDLFRQFVNKFGRIYSTRLVMKDLVIGDAKAPGFKAIADGTGWAIKVHRYVDDARKETMGFDFSVLPKN